MIGTHRLAAAHFDELAHGRGDPTAITALRRGQLSKRLLQLRAVLDRAEERPTRVGDPGSADEARTARDAYAVLGTLDRSVTSEVLLHPPVGSWLARCLADLYGAGPPTPGLVGRLGAVAITAAVLAEEDTEVVVSVRAGTVMLPMLGRLRLPAVPDGPATLRLSGGTAELSWGAGTARFRPGPGPEPGWEPLRTVRTGAGGRTLAVQLDDLDPYRDLPGLLLADRLGAADVECWQQVLGAAWRLLVRHHTGAAEALAAGLRSIVPLRDTRPDQGVSATSMDAFGAAAMSLPATADTLAVGLLHEFQHSKLGALLDLVPLYDPDRPVLLYAPWRDDPRPLGGLIQGTYAYLGVTAFWRVQRHVLAGRPARFAQLEFARWREQTARAVEVLITSGALTPEGERFVEGMAEELTGWQGDPVPAAASAGAREANLDHWLTWRARNLTPDRALVRTAARAWRTGRPCPAPGRTDPTTPGRFAPEENGRLTLLHIRLRQGDLRADATTPATGGPHAAPADLAYATGDLSAATAGYRLSLDAEPGSAHAWAGLALAAAADEDAPVELARAVWLELACEPDPAELVRWVARR